MTASAILRALVAIAIVVVSAVTAVQVEQRSLDAARGTFTEEQLRLAEQGALAVTQELTQVDAVLEYAAALHKSGQTPGSIVSVGVPLATAARTYRMAFIDPTGRIIAIDPEAPAKMQDKLRSHLHVTHASANHCLECLHEENALFRTTQVPGSDLRVAAVIPLARLYANALSRLRSGNSGYAWMLSSDGTIVGAPAAEMIGRTLSPAGQHESFRNVLSEMRAGRGGSGEYLWWDASGEDWRLAAWAPFKVRGLSGVVALSADREELAAMVGRSRLRALSVTALIGLSLAALFALLLFEQRRAHTKLRGTAGALVESERVEVARAVATATLTDLEPALALMAHEDGAAPEPAQLEAGVARIRAAVDRLSALTTSSSASTDSVFDLRDALHDAARVVQGRFEGVSMSVDADAVASVRGAQSQLTQVFVHLLDNAAAAAGSVGSEGRVVARIWQDGDRILAQIEDSGPGFSDEAMARPFDSLSAGPGKVGAGLASCRDLVIRNGGRIQLQGRGPGLGGAIVRVDLPAAEGAHSAPTAAQ